MTNNLIGELIDKAKKYQSDDEINLIYKSIDFAKNVHKEQFRVSGEPFYFHPIEVAKILTEIKLDNFSIASGILHDTIEDTSTTLNDIKENFGSEIANLVDGLTKINQYSLKVNNLKLGENYKKLLLAATNDLRVILIKLADRLHNMRTLQHIKDKKKNN